MGRGDPLLQDEEGCIIVICRFVFGLYAADVRVPGNIKDHDNRICMPKFWWFFVTLSVFTNYNSVGFG